MQQKESLHWEVRFANIIEICKLGFLEIKNNFVKLGIIVGKYVNKFLKFGGMQFVAFVASTQSVKCDDCYHQSFRMGRICVCARY
ncbi:hypothetical protein LS73_002165 [Helicobacter muridarum]|uniref:Uncharacterized protein n=1 Tax=Helicobacter muridarum TaxID=216 RepID=A0A099TY08_9HELI|nr:hypothetical protein [Helicobacter muridarum]TLE01103.1 hypothetical protein LS73_002165 [Helicobacter muridarum]STQ85967.1 Uncharacterised protein [Helicobacter muridarum]